MLHTPRFPGEENHRLPKYHDDEIISYASEYADEFIDKHSGEEGAELAIDEVYDQAPFKFQNDYRYLRESLKNLNKNMTSMFSNMSNIVGPLFDTAMENSPSEFRSMKNEKELFISVFRMMLENDASVREIFNITEDFWFYFCYHLRLNRKCHENVSNSTLDVWREKIPEEKYQFCLRLQSYAHEYESESEDPNVRSLCRSWKKNDSELNDLLSLIPDDGSGLEEFVRRVRKGGE